GFEELAVGAIASGGVRVLNEDVARALPNAEEVIESITARETAELQRREQSYRDGRPAPDLRSKTVILVDDGLATGATMRAAITKRLVAEKNFTVLAIEADWPDASRVHRYLGGATADANSAEALSGFRRFPTWMWRNTVIVEFVEWLRRHNQSLDSKQAPA